MKIINAHIPRCLLEGKGATESGEDLVLCHVTTDGDRIASVREAAGDVPEGHDVDCEGGILVPAFIDMHTHLDSGHIWARTQNPDGTFPSALNAVLGDRDRNWTAQDVALRMRFSLQAAYAYGTAAIRTHINSRQPVADMVWPVFQALREEWRDKLTLQAAALLPIDEIADDDPAPVFDTYLNRGGMVGAFLYPTKDVPQKLASMMREAENRGVDLDFHVDETLDPSVRYLGDVAEQAKLVGFSGTITCGHCCSLMTMADDDSARILDAVAEAGIAIVSLPMCNLYLQDRDAGAKRTPRVRGGTLVHEMKARGIPVAIASDNTRDPFYAYGDLDMLEVWREATRVLHLDHPIDAWPRAFSATPAAIMGLADRDALAPGAPADLVVFKARRFDELFSRPQSDRTVIRNGAIIDAAPPDYRDLDAVAG
ncbi:MAG: cytosine deaminase [Pseudomonadota bacterium]